MESTTPPSPALDEDKYRTEVLQIASQEAEQARAQQLSDEAQQLGLKVLEIDAAPLAASIASGMVDLSSPALSSGSSTDRNSACDGSVTPSLSVEPSSPSLSPSPLDQVTTSLSQLTFSSERVKPSSTRSLASLSTRPTSFCSSESRTINAGLGLQDGLTVKGNRSSMFVVTPGEKKVKEKERRRSSLKSAIGRIHFRRKRAPSVTTSPPNAQVTISKGDEGVERVLLEGPRNPPTSNAVSINSTSTSESIPKVEVKVPTFDEASLQRSLNDPELSEMMERQKMEKSRHMAFQDAALEILRRRHQSAVSEAQSENQRREDEKREKNEIDAIRIEERQCAVEMEQQREFERAKQNSRTRIKHMEGYFRNASPPPSPATADRSSESFMSGSEGTPPTRRVTRQQLEQLEQQYHAHESMDALQESRIKVLRERQEKRLAEAIARMEGELDALCDQHSKQIAALQAEHRREESSLIDGLQVKKTELRQRWNLEESILRKRLEEKHGQVYGPLPPISFCIEHESDAENRI
ncbi:uncharacterized protein N7484_007496 [Penicillium longicatenatum]|uniref:uncharacterized protein n=1 Tax=Penicillium longicatenatum TaxID=1561947 RepID=UPI00254981D8|nr:uncharacterized protein N7484_007496 [Penicillium longicatenatum]KAJ5639634.1 hypothetical protein N7484_007496 [Penicillium longicatenatum]